MKKSSPLAGILLGVAVVVSGYYAFKKMTKAKKPIDKPEKPSESADAVNSQLGIGSPQPTTWVSDTVYPIGKGSKGNVVKAIQQVLSAVEKPIDIDGFFGIQTETVFKSFYGKDKIWNDADLGNFISKANAIRLNDPLKQELLMEGQKVINKRLN